MARKGISKSVRFKIFSRDHFTCQYCGKKPPEVLLEVDHIHPYSKGGTDDEINLTTSCEDCNRGKSAHVLGHESPRPDATEARMREHQEIMEAKRYMEDKQNRDAVMQELVNTIQDHWLDSFDSDSYPKASIIKGWLGSYKPVEVEQAITCAIPAYQSGRISERYFNGMVKYVSAVMRNRREDAEVA